MCAPGGNTISGGSTSSGGSTGGGGNAGGSGTGRGIGCGDCSSGSSSSSSSSEDGAESDIRDSDEDDGSVSHCSPTQLQGALLRRFLLEEVRVLEVLGAILRSLPLFEATCQVSELAGALFATELAFKAELRHAMMEAGRRGGAAGSAGGGSGAVAGARRVRSGSKAAAGSSTGPGPGPLPVWPPDFVRSLGQQLEQQGSTCYKETLHELEDTLRANLRLGSLAQQPAGSGSVLGGGEGVGDEAGSGGRWECHVPSSWSYSMVRTLYEVVEAAAGPSA